MTTGWYSLEELVEPLLFGSYGNCWTLPWIAFSSAMNSNSIPSLHHPPFGEAKPTAYQECFSREWSQSSLVIIPATPFPSIPYVKRTSLPVSQSPSLPVTADHPCVANGWPNTLHKMMCPEIRWVNEWYEITILLTSSWEDVGKFNNAQPLEFFSRKMGFDYINHHSFPAISCQFWCIVFRQSHIDCWVYTGYIPIETHYIIPMTYQYRLLGMYVYIYISIYRIMFHIISYYNPSEPISPLKKKRSNPL